MKCKSCGHIKGSHHATGWKKTKYGSARGFYKCLIKKCDCKQFIPNNSSLDLPLLNKDPDEKSASIAYTEHSKDSGSDFILSDKVLYFTETTQILQNANYFYVGDVAEFIRLVNKLSVVDFLDGGVNKLVGSLT
ncbi:hypothetical protein LCGC14_1129280 [marine sediment metagenome]|uniref:Uncharacterized protein n=1 Tax=marine sediment metagenome TaxID=412755 RepID=A0A0F9M1N8_9ZZZZ